jgi:integrase/recombinase XerD
MTPSPATPRAVFAASLEHKEPTTQAAYLHTLSRLEAWAEHETRNVEQLQTADLRRFLAEEGRQYASSTINLRRAAVRAYYKSLHRAGVIQHDPGRQLRRVQMDHRNSSGPIADLSDHDLAHVRKRAARLGAIHSLAVCLLHETPTSIASVARLTLDELAEDVRDRRTYLLVGNAAAGKTPWPISVQAREAVEALRSEQPRLISPSTKNPNLLLVRSALEETRIDAGIHTPDLAAALKGAQRREEHELCQQVRLRRNRLAVYRRDLLPRLTILTEL